MNPGGYTIGTPDGTYDKLPVHTHNDLRRRDRKEVME
jgi:hypothetical protein